jgi:hypothetical protein
MTERPEAEYSAGTPDVPEDTVELQLTAAEQLLLSGAAAPSLPADAPGYYDTGVYARSRRIDVLGTLTFAVLVCGLAAAAGWHALARPTPVVAVTAPLTAAPAVRTHEPPPVVQVLNPFDHTEVFEVPAQATEAEARTAIAQLLLERAQQRRAQGFAAHRASLHPRPAPTSAAPDVYVTKVFWPVDRFSDRATPAAASGAAE